MGWDFWAWLGPSTGRRPTTDDNNNDNNADHNDRSDDDDDHGSYCEKTADIQKYVGWKDGGLAIWDPDGAKPTNMPRSAPSQP